MINSVKARTPILALILFVFAVGYTFAANKVVVIPLGADAVQQSFAVFKSGGQSASVGSTNTLVRQLSLTAPTDGIVIVNSTGQVGHSISAHGINCSITTANSSSDTAYTSSTHKQSWTSSGFSAGGISSQISGTRGFNVTAGNTYYYRLVCIHFPTNDGGSLGFYDSSLTAIFTPSA